MKEDIQGFLLIWIRTVVQLISILWSYFGVLLGSAYSPLYFACHSSTSRHILGYHISDKQLNHAPLRFCSTEHGPACLAHCARSQRVLCFPIIYLSHLVIVIVTKFAIHQVLAMLTHSQFCHLSLHETGYTWSHLVTKCSLVTGGHIGHTLTLR